MTSSFDHLIYSTLLSAFGEIGRLLGDILLDFF